MAQGVSRHRGHRLDGRACSICRACLSIIARRRRGRLNPKPSSSWSAGSSRRSSIRPWSASWVLGLWLAWTGGWFAAGWLQAKILLVLVLSALHGFLVRWVRDFSRDANHHSEKFYRLINEIPTVLMIGIVILAVVKPF